MNIFKIFNDGLKGFAFFFSIIMMVKFTIYFLGYSNTLGIDVIDVYHSSIGFVLYIFNSEIKKFARDI